ncbi:nuclear pore complex protein Nup50-like [Oculina patagonica]
MAKRGADKELTQDNWDQEEEDEEVGHFKVASTEDLSKRKIIKAKRRGNSSDGKGGGVFQGFSGFAGLNSNTSSFAASSFSIKPLTVQISTSTPISKNMFSGLKASSAVASTSTATPFTSLGSSKNGFKANSPDNSQASKASSSSYKDNLKALNESVSSWIQKHIAENPYVDLTPIFNDYKEHMKSIDLKFSSSTEETEKSSSTSEASNTTKQPAVSSASTFWAPSKVSQETEENRSKVSSTEVQSSQKETVESQPGTSQEDNTEEEVPKPISVVVAEEGAFHSIRCKLFFKRESTWAELGIGMLNLKKLDGKIQVLVRNDTTLGKILLNVYLAESTPISRQGKNNVILLSVPNPPLYAKPSEGDNSKPATYLIRVKTAEDADELFKQLDTNKASNN